MNCQLKQAAVSLLYFEKYRKHWQTTKHVGKSSTIFGWSSLIVWWSSLGRCAAIVGSLRKIWVMFINTRSGLDAPRTCWEKSLASYLILSMESFEVTRTTFEKPRVTAVVIEFLPSNLKNLRCNLHLFSVQFFHCCTLIELHRSIRVEYVFKYIVTHCDCNAEVLTSGQVKP